MMLRKILRADGAVEEVPNPMTTREVARAIGADTLDTVILRRSKTRRASLMVMLVDDRGWETETVKHNSSHFEIRPVRNLKPINAAATALYLEQCRPGTTHQIAGDVYICPDSDYQ